MINVDVWTDRQTNSRYHFSQGEHFYDDLMVLPAIKHT